MIIRHPFYIEKENLETLINEFEERITQGSNDKEVFREWIYNSVLGVQDESYRHKIKGFHEKFNTIQEVNDMSHFKYKLREQNKETLLEKVRER